MEWRHIFDGPLIVGINDYSCETASRPNAKRVPSSPSSSVLTSDWASEVSNGLRVEWTVATEVETKVSKQSLFPQNNNCDDRTQERFTKD